MNLFAPPGRECLQFQDVVFDGEADVAVGFGETADCFGLVDLGLEHNQSYRHAAACAFDGVYRGGAVDLAGAHQDADSALDELGVLHVYIDHQVLVHVAQAGHGAGGDHVEDHLLRGGGLHTRGTGDDLGTHIGNDGDICCIGQRSSKIAGDGGGLGSACAGIGHRSYNIWSASRGRNTHNDVLAGGAATGDISLTQLFRVLIDLDRRGQRLGSASHDVLDLTRRG